MFLSVSCFSLSGDLQKSNARSISITGMNVVNG
ncbi:hypothetical protein VPH166E361_0126 [Vibrio phage 166E36-1]